MSHGPTKTAAETQAVLPEGCLVQKTLTGKVTDKLLLWTGPGDFSVTKRQRKYAARALGLSANRDHSFNPPEVQPLEFFGMYEGMVSPFLAANSPAASRLSGLFVVPWPAEWETRSVAISMSLAESLIIPLKHLTALLFAYASIAYEHLPIFTVKQD